MTDPKIQLVRDWLGEDNPYENVGKLLTRLSAAASQPADVVERVAKALFCSWANRLHGLNSTFEALPLDQQEEWREHARAALSALPPRDEVTDVAQLIDRANGGDGDLVQVSRAIFKQHLAAERFVEFVRKALAQLTHRTSLWVTDELENELDRLDAARGRKL